jgi:LPXTG-site transpeptidase (sortase) family protein
VKGRTLHWLERMLFAIAALVVTWSVFVWLRAEYYDRLPIPPPASARAILPGEDNPREYTDADVIDSSGPAGRLINTGSWLARLEGPAVDLQATVLEGSDPHTLARAAGHIENTALPGQPGNIGIAGHRDTVFRPLRRIKKGDELKLRTSSETYTYRVSSTSIVEPHEVHVLAPTGEPTLTLVTCYPFTFIGKAPRRFIVQAKLAESGIGN